MRIGYYVHHHGRGHATRAGVIGAAAQARGHDVTYLGSGALPPGEQVALERDERASDAPFVDADAGGRLHWAPLGGGYWMRATQFAAWVGAARPDVIVVDVSVEMTALARLLGVPVVVVGQPGVRDDVAHRVAFDLAAAVLVPWPAGLGVAPHLATRRDTVVEVGGISRFVGLAQGRHGAGPDRVTSAGSGGAAEVDSLEAAMPAPVRGALLVGGEGWDDPTLPAQVREALTDVEWREPGENLSVETLLGEADVVVTHAGQNALADIACFEVPTVVVPQQRPFDEQADMARALEAAGIARGLALGAGVVEIAQAVREVLLGAGAAGGFGPSWRAWNVVGAADRAVDVIERAGRLRSPGVRDERGSRVS